MAGNVWEWCLNEYDSPEKTSSNGNANRVLRGGSWFGTLADARTSFRGCDFPDLRLNNVGFRVVCASPL
jgi:formylglycine-generating enzyme required for sulfatase activity